MSPCTSPPPFLAIQKPPAMCLLCPFDLLSVHIPDFYKDFVVSLPDGVKAISAADLRIKEGGKFVDMAERLEEYVDAPDFKKRRPDIRPHLAGKVVFFDRWVRSAWTGRFSFVPDYELTALDRLSSTVEVGRHLLSLVADDAIDLRMPQYLFQISRFRAFLLNDQAEFFPQRILQVRLDDGGGRDLVEHMAGNGAVVSAKRCLEGQEDGGETKKTKIVTPE